MFTRKNAFIIFFVSCLIFGAVLVSATLPVGTNSNAQIAHAADASYRVAANTGDIIMVQSEPSPTPLATLTDESPTDEPPATLVPVPTVDPNDPAQNPGAPGGTLTTIVQFLVGALVGALTMLIGMLSVISRLKDDAVAKTTIERLIDGLANSFPAAAPLKPLINEAGKEMQSAGTVLEQVTDGKPNL